MRYNPTPYTLPVIPRPLPSNIVEGEHFVLKDVRRLASGNASSSRDLVVGAPSRVQEARSSSSATSGRGSDSPPASDRGTRGQHNESLLTLAPTVRAAPRVVKVLRKRVFKRQDAPESRCENFVPWVPDDSEGPQDLEEEARMERSMRLLDRYAARKRKRQVNSSEESGAPSAQPIELSPLVFDNSPTVDESSGERAITISGSPELGPTGESGPDGAIQP